MSTTSSKGCITYANSDFIKYSGFSPEELLQQPHNIVRHPDIPPAVFKHMWETLKKDRSWMGLIKNRCKNGDHYWVSAYVTPLSQNGSVVEYQSVRTKPMPEHVAAAEKAYAQMKEGKHPPSKPAIALSLKINTLIWASLIITMTLASLLAEIPLLAAMAVTLASGCLSSAVITMSLSPLQKLTKISRDIGDNPLSQSLYTGRNDEFGQIEFALLMMQAEAGSVIGRMRDASTHIDSYTDSLLREIEAGNTLSAAQQEETDQIATAVNQMSVSIQEVASNALNAADAADAADNETSSGQRMVADTSQSITDLEVGIRQAASVIQDLENQSSEISKILEVIRSIAEQTNLLALNAAIEAARAGNQGRGFAVVADEVRSLAGRTQRSTADIQNMISTLQECACSAVKVMEQSSQQAHSSVNHAQHASTALIDIGLRVNEITEMNTQIATAVEQQSAVSEEINRSITKIRSTSEMNVQLGQENYKSTAAVAGLSSAMHDLARQFWEKRNQSPNTK